MSHAIYRYGYCETDMSAMLLEILKPGMIFFDVGAHFGYATLLGSALVGEQGQVHAFEPTPSSFQILKANAMQAGNIHINNIAVYSKRERLTFHDFGLRSSTLNTFFAPRIDQRSDKYLASTVYQVQTISLDEYAKEIGVMPDVIKIDAESAESQILQGMELIFSEARPAIIMEVGDLPGALSESAHLVKFLVEKQYRVFKYFHGALVEVEQAAEFKYEPGNRLFIRVQKNK